MRIIPAIPWKIHHFPEVYPIGHFVPWVLIPLWNLLPCWDEWMLGIVGEDGRWWKENREAHWKADKQMMRIDRFRPLSSRASAFSEMVQMEFVLCCQQSTVGDWSSAMGFPWCSVLTQHEDSTSPVTSCKGLIGKVNLPITTGSWWTKNRAPLGMISYRSQWEMFT